MTNIQEKIDLVNTLKTELPAKIKEKTDALKLIESAKTESEKNAAISALKAAFPDAISYQTKWSDGTVSE